MGEVLSQDDQDGLLNSEEGSSGAAVPETPELEVAEFDNASEEAQTSSDPAVYGSHGAASGPARNVQFGALKPGPAQAEAPKSIDLLLDVRLQLTVELGRRDLTIKEALSLGPGSVVELDRIAGEPVDMFVNNKLIARGEVVVIDDNFGVRVTEVVSPAERVNQVA